MKLKSREVLIGVFVVVLLCFIYFLVSLEEEGEREEKIVTKIIDGDTIVVQGGEKIRLLGVDCDEKGDECYSKAKEILEEKLLGETVFLESDLEDKDRYGRSLRYIFLDGENINVFLVEKGYCIARFEREGAKYKEEIVGEEEGAIEGRVGCKWDGA